MNDPDAVWRKLEMISEICASLATEEDDAVRMFALRVDALSKSFRDSMLVPPLRNSGSNDD